jgi:hypothetical protein
MGWSEDKERKEHRERRGPARQGDRSVLCDGRLKVIQRERGGRKEKKGGEEEGLRGASAPLT